jgi:hypothetical protein
MSSTQEKLEEFLHWVMANRDVHSRRWADEIEPELKRQLTTLIDSAKREAVRAYIEPHLQACRDYNGRDYCKNCGLTEQSEESE